jgi:hypothetical protein
MILTTEQVLANLDNAEPHGDGWRADCPLCRTHHSLSIRPGNRPGVILLRCYGPATCSLLPAGALWRAIEGRSLGFDTATSAGRRI